MRNAQLPVMAAGRGSQQGWPVPEAGSPTPFSPSPVFGLTGDGFLAIFRSTK
ncbi:MAG: hypothetical protein ABL903_08555 [Methylococcales bacterium]